MSTLNTEQKKKKNQLDGHQAASTAKLTDYSVASDGVRPLIKKQPKESDCQRSKQHRHVDNAMSKPRMHAVRSQILTVRVVRECVERRPDKRSLVCKTVSSAIATIVDSIVGGNKQPNSLFTHTHTSPLQRFDAIDEETQSQRKLPTKTIEKRQRR